MSDQQRLAVVLQGVATIAHCVQGGWKVPRDWPVDSSGRLRLDPPRPGVAPALPQRVALALLREAFRTDGDIAGRGTARRAARRLVDRFDQALEPVDPDRLVGWVLDAAPFLWAEGFADARRALAGWHGRGDPIDSADRERDSPEDPGAGYLWVAGPGRSRRRLLAAVAPGSGESDLATLQERLASADARDLWEGHAPGDDPHSLLAAGRPRRAVAAWRRQKRLGEDAVPLAETLFLLGHHRDSLDRLARRTDPASLLSRARAQMELGERRAAAKSLARLTYGRLEPLQQVTAAEMSIRLAAGRGDAAALERWEARLETLARSTSPDRASAAVRALAWIAAAGAAWDRDVVDTMTERLEQAAPLCFARGEAAEEAREDAREDARKPTRDASIVLEARRRWHQAEGLRRLRLRDGDGAAEHLAKALGCGRRQVGRAAAGRLWSDLAVVRVAADDLAGAERACRHALRLLGGCDGTAATTLALYNLAEVRLRRGRLDGVAATLERSTAANRRAGNGRGIVRDYELWVRLELALGRARGALARIAEAERLADRQGAPVRRALFRVFTARALGWLGRPDEAAEALRSASDGGAADRHDEDLLEALDDLEPEERPAVWALAGRPDEALRAAHGGPWQSLWSALAEGLPPTLDAFDALDALEPYRAARLTLDIECAVPGVVPASRRQRAIAVFRRLGARAWVERLGGADAGWNAVRRYLEAPPGPRADALPDLFEAAGYGTARLAFAYRGDEAEWVRGAAGAEPPERLRLPIAGGELVLRSERLDPPLHALAWLAARTARPPERRQREVDGARDGVIGDSEALRSTLSRLDRLAVGDLPLLVQGESGTGKELAARRAHRRSRRAEGPFVAINCAALSESLIQSDLFGHVRGAFTGADRDRAGVFESARGGTVFLDEIGDLPPTAQGKLLRVLQEKEVRRLGESLTRKVDVRIIAATHRNLAEMVEDDAFRQDLYFRLRVATVTLPPLRDRGDDVLLLAEHFLAALPGAPTLEPAARRRLLDCAWTGNVRELRNVLEVAAALAEGDAIEERHLELPGGRSTEARGDYHGRVERFRRRLVGDALREAGGNQSRAARHLGLSRQALSYLVKQLDLS